MKPPLTLLAILLSISAFSQWTTSGTSILNTNSGYVKINKPSAMVDDMTTIGIADGSFLSIAPTSLSSTNNAYILMSFPTSTTFRIGTNYDGNLGSSKFRDIEFGRHNSAPYMTIKDGGNVGIGTTDPGSFKLAVEGKIGARELKVMLTNPFPDYVFNKNYKLMNLASLEKYIQSNKHLPGIPSANEVEKNGGFEVGQMNVKLLEKIEELTLHLIEQSKEIEKLKAEMKQVRSK